jgi:CRISPR system Cascade subunit CasE
MFFSKIDVMPSLCGGEDAVFQWFSDRGFNEYSIHQLLWNTFEKDPDADRSFLFREDKNKQTGMPQLLLLSEKEPLYDQEILRITKKNFSPKIISGMQLAFDVRMNPVVTRVRQGYKNSAKHDLWADAKKRGKKEGKQGKDLNHFIEKEIRDWFLSRSESWGFHVEDEQLLLEEYRKHEFSKSNKPGSTRKQKLIVFNSLNFKGILTVKDSAKFKESLCRGIGRSKAFGCGLLLIRRV